MVEWKSGTLYRRSTRWNILPIIGINKYIDYKIIVDRFNIKKFNLFIRLLLRKINSYPNLKSVLILDNASCYRSLDLVTIYEEASVRLEFLPLYLPDYSMCH
jgi:hypothetical protein